jgi:uncharacterized phage-associated protein
MSELKFTFSLDKLIHSLALFSTCGVRDLTKLKAAKLLYFADKDHLLKFGRPIIGDVYYCLPYGPVPSVSLNEMNDAINVEDIDDGNDIHSDSICFASVLKIHKPLWGGHPVFRAKNGFDRDVFSKSEISSLEFVVQQFGDKQAAELVELTHKETAWMEPNKVRKPNGRAPMPYELFFHDADANAQEVLAFAKEEQREQRSLESFIQDISRSEDLQVYAKSGTGRAEFQGML